MVTTKALLTTSVRYKRLSGEQVCLYPGTCVDVDVDNEIALYEGDHLDISSEEYEILYLN